MKIYYRNQFSSNYKVDESAIRKIIKNHVFQFNIKLKLIIYYKNRTTSQLITKNNLAQKQIPSNERSHLVYEFKCQEGECITLNNSYIGMTHCKLRERFEYHKNRGSIFAHFHQAHNRNPTLDELLASTKVIYVPDNPLRVDVFEALFIRERKPELNENKRNFACLKLEIF